MKPLVLCFLGLTAFLYGLHGCVKRDLTPGATSEQKLVFRYPIRTNPASLDPTRAVDVESFNLQQQIYEGLMGISEESQPIPKIAEKVEIKGKGRVYLFRLREGVRFSSGREVRAEDFKWSFERNCSPKLYSQTARTYLGCILGVREKIAGKAREIKGIQALGPYLLKVILEKPCPYFLGKLTHPVAAVLDRQVVPADREITSLRELGSAAPYQVSAYFPNQLIQLRANPHYHVGVPKTELIEIPILKDSQVCLNKFKSGDLDVTYVQSQDVVELQKDPVYKSQLQIYPTASVLYLSLNPDGYPPFRDLRVRRAVAMSIDREDIVDRIMDGVHVAAYSLLPPRVLGYQNMRLTPPYDPEGARKLLKGAGYVQPSAMPVLRLYLVDQSTSARRCAEAIAMQITSHLRIPVQLHRMDLGTLYQKHSRKQLEFTLIGWKPTYLDPENYLSTLLLSSSPMNYSGYKNKFFDALCQRADHSMDPKERHRLYAKAEKMALQDVALIPLYFFRDAELVNHRVRGLKRSLFGHLPYVSVELKPNDKNTH
jgi:ABC-type transport system substrate-binding protein